MGLTMSVNEFLDSLPSKGTKKINPKTKTTTTKDIIDYKNFESENIVRLKLSKQKGTRIESVPAKKT